MTSSSEMGRLDRWRVVRAARRLAKRIERLARFSREADEAVRTLHAEAVRTEVAARLASSPPETLEPYLGGTRGLNLLRSAGYRSVAQVRAASLPHLEHVKGIGRATATNLQRAAYEFEAEIISAARVRFDSEARPELHTELLQQLREARHRRDVLAAVAPSADRLRASVTWDLRTARRASGVRALFSSRATRDDARLAVERLAQLLESDTPASVDAAEAMLAPPAGDVWRDYFDRTAELNGLLSEICQLSTAEEMHGHLSSELVEAINSAELDLSLLRCRLRGYQMFGAKFALTQVRGILGDEMGLGKTVQALALLCHLRRRGFRHFLVVSPASVLANWEHEIERHTDLADIHRLHGPDRDQAMAAWRAGGGVALTTFGTLSRLAPPDVEIAALIVDEAHYVKNPDAKRTQAVVELLRRPTYALLMSGTPMENRPEEFRWLVELVRPDLVAALPADGGLRTAAAFRRAVAPAYLRRNQPDVLSELPELIETEEWLPLIGEALVRYTDAVRERNFQAMRQAAIPSADPRASNKLRRIVELVEEAAANERKVVIFSYYRAVLDRIEVALGARAMGQINGSVPASRRQELLDRFSESEFSGALVCQIQAGGVGMNMQAASVVILAEPQWKPSTEQQAVARCHRMGQARRVEVHRLLSENAVDERMRELVHHKSELFDAFARPSTLKESAAQAVDATTEPDWPAVALGEAEEQIITWERERLGV